MKRVQSFVGNITNGSVNFADGENGEVRRETVDWKNGVVLEGDRRGCNVVVAPINPAGLYQVIFATGAVGWYLPSDIRISEVQ